MGNGARYNLAAIGIVLSSALLLGYLNQDVLAQIGRYSFDDGTYSHAFIIPFISLFFMYKAVHEQGLVFRQRRLWLGITLQLVIGLVYLITITAQLSLGYLGLLPLVLASFYLSLFRFNRYLIASAVVLLFAVPVWGGLTLPLQHLSIFAVGKIMGLTGIPTYIEGESFTIPNGVFAIVGGCSGLRYLLVSLLISFLYITLYLKQKRTMAHFLCVAILGALLANWIRITLLILIGYYTDMQSSILPDHNHFGWYVYAPFLLILFAWGQRLQREQAACKTQGISTAKSNALQPVHVLAVAMLLLSSTAWLNAITAEWPMQPTRSVEGLYPTPQIHGADRFDVAIELSGLQIHHYYYSGRQIEHKATHFEHSPIPHNWSVLAQHQLDNGMPLWHVQSETGQKGMISQYYRSAGVVAPTAAQQKRYRLKHALFGKRASELIWFYQPCTPSCAAIQPSLTQKVMAHPLRAGAEWVQSP